MNESKKYWLMKSEGESYSIDDLRRDKVTAWEGVRNYQARNFMQSMAVGDLVLFYHSGGEPGVYGVAKVSAQAHPDMSQYKKDAMYHEPRATKEKPVWYCVDIRFVEKFKSPVALAEIKNDPALDGIMVAARGSRLSVQPVSEKHFEYIRTILGAGK